MAPLGATLDSCALQDHSKSRYISFEIANFMKTAKTGPENKQNI